MPVRSPVGKRVELPSARSRRKPGMIVADLSALRAQVVLTPNMDKGIAFLLNLGHDELSDGRVVIDD